MDARETPARLSLSHETLVAELSQMELRLVDRINAALSTKADAVVVDQVEKRVGALEITKASRESLPSEILELTKRVSALEKFRYAVPSAAILSLVASVALVILVALGGHA